MDYCLKQFEMHPITLFILFHLTLTIAIIVIMEIFRSWQICCRSNIVNCCSLCFILLLISCTQDPHQAGRKLAAQHCQGCHTLPNPQDLNKNTWQFEVLPLMAARLGHNSGKSAEIETLKEMHLLPESPLLTSEEWNQIKNYFITVSPAFAKPSQTIKKITPQLSGFRVFDPLLKSEPPFMSMVHVDSTRQQFFYGNSTQQTLNIYEMEKGKTQSIKLSGSPSHLIAGENGDYVLTMGMVMPHNKKSGTLTFIPKNPAGEWLAPEIWINDLQRPVHASLGDLDGDGKDDMVIASFGNYQGELVWYSDVASPQRKKHVLKPLPGAIKSVLADFNDDGLTDILALMAQGDEGLFLFLNQGNGSFKEQILKRFPPTYGSTYFDWIDMDGDGLNDILYVNGDNGDYFPIVKNFHGIRLFRNKGNLEFEEVFFLEQHGAFKAKAVDFDRDGDLDIAAISYFPDYQDRPEESFVYYENTGNLEFEAFSFEQQPRSKWLTMESGDIDGDGDQDIMLGTALFMTQDAPAKLSNDWRRNAVLLLILENVGKAGSHKN